MLLYLFLNIMDEKLFKYGSYEIDRDLLLQNIQQNVESWIKHYQYDDERAEQFRTAVGDIYKGMQEGAITGNGFGKFTDSRGIIQRSSATEDASNYIHSLTNQLGSALKELEKNKPAVKPEDPIKFNNDIHGFSPYFLKSLAGVNQSKESVDAAISYYRDSFNKDIKKTGEDFANRLAEWQTINNKFSNLDFSGTSYTSESYNNDINTLRSGISDGEVSNADRELARRLGLDNVLNAVFGVKSNPSITVDQNKLQNGQDEQNKQDSTPIAETPSTSQDIKDLTNLGWTINKQNKWVTPDGKTTFFDATEHPLQNIAQMSFGNYLNENYIENSDRSRARTETGDVENTGFNSWYNALGKSDQYRLQSIGFDLVSILWPTPAIAAGAGYTSDWLQYQADKMDGNISLGKTLGNIALSTVGSIPGLGDLGMSAKVITKIKKALPIISGLLVMPGIAQVINNPDMYKDIFDKIQNHPKDLTVEDMRSLYDLLTYTMGGFSMFKRIGAKEKANRIYDESQDALSITVKSKNKGNKNIHITDEEGIRQLKTLENDPEAFKNYLKNNYEGLDDIELANIKSKTKLEWTDEQGKLQRPKRKTLSSTVKTDDIKVIDKKPSIFNRSRYYLNRKDQVETKNTVKRKSTTPDGDNTPQWLKYEMEQANKQNADKSLPDTGKPDTPQNPTETPKITEEIPELESQKIEGSKPVSEVKPDTKPNINPEGLSLNIDSFVKSNLDGQRRQRVLNYLNKINRNKRNANKKRENVRKGKKAYGSEVMELANALVDSKQVANLNEALDRIAEAGIYKQGGILKAQTGIQFPNIDLLNHSKYQGWNKFFTYDQLTGTLSLNDGINQGEFNNWLTDNNLQFNNPTANYGKDYTKSGDYNSVYETNASSKNWAGADFTNRSKNLSDLGNLNRQNELDLNSHVKSMYQNDSSQRNSDFINWFNVGKYSDLDSMLKAYNTEIDAAYKYKRSTEGTTYGQSEYTRAFNQSHKKRHASQNEIGGLYGYDEGSEHINGSTTMARGIDITNDDILLDVSSNNMLKEWLRDNQLWKDKSGRIYVKDPNGFTLSELNSEKTPDKPEIPEKTTTHSEWGIGDGNDGPPPPPANVPEKKQTIDWGTLLSSANYFGYLLHNKKQLELNAELEPLYYDPKEDYRYTYGNLRAIAEGRQSAADIQRQAAKPMTSDGSLQTATSLEAATLAQKFINEGLKTDDLALGESLEKAWEQMVENHENRYNIAMKNRENAKAIKDQKLLARMNRLRSDYESTVNFIKEMQTRLEAKANEKKTYRDYFYNQALLANIENDPNGHLAKLGQPTLTGKELLIWQKGLTNPMSLSDEEMITYQSIRAKISNIHTHYMAKEYGVDMPTYITKAPIGEWKLDTSKIRSIVPGRKKGGKITSDMTKTIIAYLKESNKNYNKAIDRSIRGLYNHIKLQKK